MFFWGFGVLLTNAYVMYCKKCDEKKIPKKDRRTHFEFRRDLAMTWINEEYFKSYKEGKRKLNYAFGEDSIMSPITLYSTLKSVGSKRSKRSTLVTTVARNSQITDDSLEPESGRLRCRLNKNPDHLPEKPMSKTPARCGLHRWLGHETCKQVSYCNACAVNLCIGCYKLFHQEEHRVRVKDQLKKTIVNK